MNNEIYTLREASVSMKIFTGVKHYYASPIRHSTLFSYCARSTQLELSPGQKKRRIHERVSNSAIVLLAEGSVLPLLYQGQIVDAYVFEFVLGVSSLGSEGGGAFIALEEFMGRFVVFFYVCQLDHRLLQYFCPLFFLKLSKLIQIHI